MFQSNLFFLKEAAGRLGLVLVVLFSLSSLERPTYKGYYTGWLEQPAVHTQKPGLIN